MAINETGNRTNPHQDTHLMYINVYEAKDLTESELRSDLTVFTDKVSGLPQSGKYNCRQN